METNLFDELENFGKETQPKDEQPKQSLP